MSTEKIDQQDEYDGSIPEHLSFEDGNINFTQEDVKEAYEKGEIDGINYIFLSNVLDEYAINPEVVRAILLYRMRVKEIGKPGQELFIRMNELGLIHHPDSSLYLDGYELPEIHLIDAIIDGSLSMRNSIIRGDVILTNSKIDGNVDQQGMEVGGKVKQNRMKVGGDVNQNGMEVEEDVNQNGMEVGGDVNQNEMKVEEDVNQTNMQIGGGIEQKGIEVGGKVLQKGIKVGRPTLKSRILKVLRAA